VNRVDTTDKNKEWFAPDRQRVDPLDPTSGTRLYFDPAANRYSQDKADITTIYSIPRLTILFFPKF
jgi:hypothetical protein